MGVHPCRQTILYVFIVGVGAYRNILQRMYYILM